MPGVYEMALKQLGPGFINKSLLLNNSTGETLEVYVLSETPVFRNEVSDEPLDMGSGGAGGFGGTGVGKGLIGDSLANHIKFLPAKLNIQGLLAHAPSDGRPGTGRETYGSIARPVATHYDVGRRFSNEVTTFAWMSPNFPGVVFDDLMLEEFAPSASTRFANAYEVTLVLKAVLTVEGGAWAPLVGRFGTKPSDKTASQRLRDESVDRGKQGMNAQAQLEFNTWVNSRRQSGGP